MATTKDLPRLAEVKARAVKVLGSEERAVRWLHSANHALNGDLPISLINSEVGARLVEELLGRIEHGLYS